MTERFVSFSLNFTVTYDDTVMSRDEAINSYLRDDPMEYTSDNVEIFDEGEFPEEY